MKESLIVILSSIITSFGFVARYFWERKIEVNQSVYKIQKEEREFKLKKFYYPLYFNLNRLSNIWEIITTKKKTNDNQVINDLEAICLDIHEENQNIIRNNIVEAKPIPALLKEIEKYDKHVTIYKTIKKNNIENMHSREYNAQYPDKFIINIKQRITELEV